VSREDDARLDDVVGAIEAIKHHLTRGGLDDGLVYDAVRVRLIEIGEAVKGDHAGTARSTAPRPLAGHRPDARSPRASLLRH
jgi:uncharacterized protein with HEPN domain